MQVFLNICGTLFFLAGLGGCVVGMGTVQATTASVNILIAVVIWGFTAAYALQEKMLKLLQVIRKNQEPPVLKDEVE